MAQYTIAIRDIITDADPDMSPMQLDFASRVSAAARSKLFGPWSLSRLNPSYIDMFCVGFATRFWEEEIGLETITAFQTDINGTLYRNAEYINAIFDLLNKQLLSQYTTQVTDNNSETDWKQTQKIVTLEDASAIATTHGTVNRNSDTLLTGEVDTTVNQMVQGDGSVTAVLGTRVDSTNTGNQSTLQENDTVQHTIDDRRTEENRETDTNVLGGNRTNTGSNIRVEDRPNYRDDTTRTPRDLTQTTTGANTEFHRTYPQTSVASNQFDPNYLTSSSRLVYDDNGVVVTQSGSEEIVVDRTNRDSNPSTTTTIGDPSANQSTTVAVGANGDPSIGSTTTQNVEANSHMEDDALTTNKGTVETTRTDNLQASQINSGQNVTTDNRSTETNSSTDQKTNNEQNTKENTLTANNSDTETHSERTLNGNNEYNTQYQAASNANTQTVMPLDVFYRSAPLIERVWALFKDSFLGVYNTGN